VAGKAKEIRMYTRRCKVCGICVEFCPAGVLVLRDGKSYVDALEKCTACNMCDLRCPDFAITVIPIAAEKSQAACEEMRWARP